jgi:hypothetical protein
VPKIVAEVLPEVLAHHLNSILYCV